MQQPMRYGARELARCAQTLFERAEQLTHRVALHPSELPARAPWARQRSVELPVPIEAR